MKLPSKIQFADEKVKQAVEELKKYDKEENMSISNWVYNLIKAKIGKKTGKV